MQTEVAERSPTRKRVPGRYALEGELVLGRSGKRRKGYLNCAHRALGSAESALLAEIFVEDGLFLLHNEGPRRADLNTSATTRAGGFVNDRQHQIVIPTW